MESRTLYGAIGIALVIIYAAGSGLWVSSSPGWYAALNRPSWQPPDFVFGLIWPYNFFVLGLTAIRVAQKMDRSLNLIWLTLFALSVVTALLWAYNFYVPHRLFIAAIFLGITAILTIPMLVIAYKCAWQIGLLLTPYQLWVAIATTLAFGYALRN